MGVINRRAFTSSQTGTPGTPGLDFSTTRALSSVASGFDAVAAQIERNKEPLNQLEAIRLSQDIDLDFNQAVGKIQKDFITNPNLNPADYPQVVDGIFNASVKGGLNSTENKRVRQLVELNQQKSRGGKLAKANEFALGQQGIRLKTTLEQNQNNDTLIASGLDSMGDLALHLRNVEANVTVGSQGLSAKEAARISIDYPKANVQAYVSGKIDRDPLAGFEEFRSDPFFAGFFDEKEREEIEEQFLFKITGERERAKFGVLLEGFRPFDKLIEDGNLIGDAPALVDILMEAQRLPDPDPELERTLQNMISSARKQSKLNVIKDADLDLDLEREKDSLNNFLDEEDYAGFMKNATTFAGKVSALQSEGKITDATKKGLLKPIQKFMNEATQIISAGDAPKVKTSRPTNNKDILLGAMGLTPMVFSNTIDTYKKNPVSVGIKKIEDKIAPIKDKILKKNLRGEFINNLYEEIYGEGGSGEDITNEQVDLLLEKIYRENAARLNHPDLSSDAGVFFLSPDGDRYVQLPNGTFSLVG